jgi:RHS repeat-associated protein
MAVITDEPAATETPAVESLADYYPFGMTMPGRSYNAHTYRHGFTGHEKESDLAEGIYTTEYRLYDARVGRWLSVDPLFEKYVGMSPYNYCAGNPVMMVDPDGRKLRYSQGATEAFKGNFKSACSYLRKHDAGQILSKIEQSESTVFIKEITNRSSYYSPKKKTIFWNPYQGLETTDGKLLSPTTVLNHEADHALDDIENPVEHNRNRKTSDANFDNKEERRVILGTETETAIKLGEIEKGQISRDDHSGYETRTSSPISKDAIFVNYPTLDEVEVIFEQSKCDEK